MRAGARAQARLKKWLTLLLKEVASKNLWRMKAVEYQSAKMWRDRRARAHGRAQMLLKWLRAKRPDVRHFFVC